MRNTPNYPNRADKELNSIRKIVAGLPKWQRHAILNRCDKLAVLYRRQQADGAGGPTPTEEHDAIAERWNATREIVAALLAGETLCHLDGPRFRTSEFHTRIVDARIYIERHYYPMYAFRKAWSADHRHMNYWLETL